jgi:hypothetical protein
MLLVLGSGWFSGCKSAPRHESAEIYVFPKLNYTNTPEFSFTKSERHAALEHLKRLDGELLYEVVADREGHVIRIRTVKSLPGRDSDYYTIGFRQRIENHKFKPSKMAAPYRTFFYPMNITSKTEFLGSQGFLDFD